MTLYGRFWVTPEASGDWANIQQFDTGGFSARVQIAGVQTGASIPPAAPGWHLFEIRADSAGVTVKLDGATVLANPSIKTFRFVTLDVWGGPGGAANYDDFSATLNQSDLLISNTGNGILHYDGTTGAFLGYFVAPGAGGLAGPGNFIFGPDGNLYVSSNSTGSIKRYNGITGAYINDFVPPGSGGIADPGGLVFGRDGNLYVAIGAHSPGGGKVARYSGTTGAPTDDFVPNGSGGISYAQDLVFGPDGNLYVADQAAGILRYNGTTGAFMGVFAPTGGGDPTSLKFGPDGNLYVTLFYGHAIKRYNGATGADMGDFVAAGNGGSFWDFQLVFGPDGNLYETERYAGSVKQYNGTTGAYINDFISGLGEVLGLLWFRPGAPITTVSNTVATLPPGQSFTVDGIPYTAAQSFQWLPGSSHTLATPSPQGSGGTQYVFQGWSDGGAISHTVTAGSTATTYTANFTTQYYLTTAATAGGSISPASGFFNAGATVSVSATATPGYVFRGFMGDLTGTTTPQNISMNAPRTITADFAPNTPAGANVSVQPTDTTTGATPATLSFSSVTQAGITSLTTSSAGSPPPTGFKLATPPTYYNISTTATFAGSVLLCINYSSASFSNPSKLRLFHEEAGAWVNITVSLDTTNHVICGSATSLSPFGVFESTYSATVQPPIKADGSSIFNSSRSVVPAKFTLTLNGVATCQLPPATIALYRTGGAEGPVNESDFVAPSDVGSNFRVDNASCQYIYNIGTSSLGSGSYLVQIQVTGVVVGTAAFGLQ